MENKEEPVKNLEIDDADGKLHLYICAALDGRRWAGQFILEDEKRNFKDFRHMGEALILSTARSLIKRDIITGHE